MMRCTLVPTQMLGKFWPSFRHIEILRNMLLQFTTSQNIYRPISKQQSALNTCILL